GSTPFDLQNKLIPFPLFQPPINPVPQPPDPNKCPAVGGNCWGGLIGWGKVACTDVISSTGVDNNGNGICQTDPGPNNDFPRVPRPGSAGSINSAAPIECTTGTVTGLSIGYDGDLNFDLIGPDVLHLVNYHNFQPGPGGTEPPNGIDVEIPLAFRPIFMNAVKALRPGMTVRVCGRWVADMRMLWNELHPVTSLSLLAPLTITANNATQVYGDATPAFTVSYNGFVNGDTPAVLGGTLSCTTTATPASPVGNYPITCSGQTSSTYAITYMPGTLSVTQAPLAIVANNATRPYGSANPPFTVTANGLLNGDTLASIGVSPSCSTSATTASPAGAYP